MVDPEDTSALSVAATPCARPILFSALMVRALLSGAKTQTRRIVKPQPDFSDGKIAGRFTADDQRLGRLGASIRCPYGAVGGLLIVREECWMFGQWRCDGLTKKTRKPKWRFHAIGQDVRYENPGLELIGYRGKGPGFVWRPGMFMPRWASRLTLRLTDVRVQRLQEISETDAQAEGVQMCEGGAFNYCAGTYTQGFRARGSFASLWATINGGESWDANPYLWTLTFEVIHKNVDEVLKT